MSFAIVDKTIGIGRKAFTIVKPYLPTIAVVGGSIAVLGGTFFACKATLHVDEVLAEHNASMEHIREVVEKLPEGKITDNEIKKDKLRVYALTARKLTSLYAPAVGLTAAGFMAIFAGFGAIKKWHALAVSSVTALDKKFGDYRANVVKEYGADVDKELAGETVKGDKVLSTKVDKETGEEKDVVYEEVVLENCVEDDFTRVFDCSNPKWDNTFVMNDNFIKTIIDWYKYRLGGSAMDHVFLNMMLKEFGFPETGIGHFYGWTDEPGCGIDIQVIPCLRVYAKEDDEQFPMLVRLDFDSYNWRWNDEKDEIEFREAYRESDKNVAYILKFNVNTDENGVPRQIYNKVFSA